MKFLFTLIIVLQLFAFIPGFSQCYKSYYGGGNSYVPPATYKTYTYTTYTAPSYTPSYKSYTPSYNYNSYNSYNSYTPKSYNSYNYNSSKSKSTYTPSTYYNSGSNSNTSYSNSGQTNSTTSYYYTKLIFASDADANGNPVSPSTSFNMKPGGGLIKIILNNNNQPLNTSQLIIDIYKQDAYGKYQFYETKYQNITSNWIWASWDYSLTSAGKYKFSIYTSGSVFIKSGEISVIDNNSNTSTNNYSNNTTTNTTNNNKTVAAAPAPAPSPGAAATTDPYLYSKLTFALGVDASGNAQTESSSFSITPQGGVIQVIVKNTQAMSTPRLKVYINKKDSQGKYIYHDIKEFDINSKSYFTTYFPYTFYTAGDYQLIVYDKDSKYVNTGYLSITNR